MIASFASCNKEHSNPKLDPVDKTNYFPLEIGNYWIYEHYDIDSSGIETERNRTDNVILSRDTIINGNQYFILEGTNYPFDDGNWGIVDILRDSSGYLVNEKGQIEFSADNFADTLNSKPGVFNNDTLYTLTYQMEKVSDPVTVPAGEFEVLNFKGPLTTYRLPTTDHTVYVRVSTLPGAQYNLPRGNLPFLCTGRSASLSGKYPSL